MYKLHLEQRRSWTIIQCTSILLKSCDISLSISRISTSPSIKGIIRERRNPLSWKGGGHTRNVIRNRDINFVTTHPCENCDCTTPTRKCYDSRSSIPGEFKGDGCSKRESRSFVTLARFIDRTTTWRVACGRLERLACCEIIYRRGAMMNLSVAQVLHARYWNTLHVNSIATGLSYRLQSMGLRIKGTIGATAVNFRMRTSKERWLIRRRRDERILRRLNWCWMMWNTWQRSVCELSTLRNLFWKSLVLYMLENKTINKTIN